MEALLPAHLFKRVIALLIIFISQIEAYTADAMEVNGVSIPVGRAYRSIIETVVTTPLFTRWYFQRPIG